MRVSVLVLLARATFSICGKLGLIELREVRHLRDENARLKRFEADLTMNRHNLPDVIRSYGPAKSITAG